VTSADVPSVLALERGRPYVRDEQRRTISEIRTRDPDGIVAAAAVDVAVSLLPYPAGSDRRMMSG
jgi:hypothetical protein